MSFLTLILSVVGILGLSSLRDAQEEITNEVYPSVQRAHFVAIESNAITLQLPLLSESQTIEDVERRGDDILVRETKLLGLLDTISSENISPELLFQMRSQVTALSFSATSIEALVKDTLRLRDMAQLQTDELLTYSQELQDESEDVVLSIGEKTISGSKEIREMIRTQGGAAPERVVSSFDSFLLSNLVDSNLISDLQLRNQKIRDDLRNFSNIDNLQDLQILHESISLNFRAITHAVVRVSNAGIKSSFKGTLANFSNGLYSIDNLFGTQASMIENRAVIQEKALDVGRRASKISELVRQFVISAQLKMNESNTAIQATAESSQITLISITFVTWIASIYIYVVYIHKNIIRRLNTLSGAILSLTQGQLDEKVLSFNDDQITKLEEAVETLRQRSLKLRQAEENLLVYSDELERSNSDLQQFAYITAHDLRAPLRGLKSLATWIDEDFREGNLDDVPPNMKKMLGRVERMDLLLTGILTYSRAGFTKEDIQELNFEEEVAGVVLDLGIKETFKVDVEARSKIIKTGKMFFRQALGNLMSNAVKHHAKGGGRILVEFEVDLNKRCNHLVVSDDGQGIPEAMRDRVFQIFQTLKPKDEVEASGIGLTLVKKLIDRRQGNITLEESAFGGLRVVLAWPLEEKQNV